MKEAHYRCLAAFFSAHPSLERLLIGLCCALPVSIMVIYPLMLLYLWSDHSSIPWGEVVWPAMTLAGTEILRRLAPRPRPFDAFAISPLIPHASGGSLPSRHSASALAIALVGYEINPLIGILLTLIALMVGATRVLTGLHFPRDIAVGYILALAMGLPGLLFL